MKYIERRLKRKVSGKIAGIRIDNYLVKSGIGISRNQVEKKIKEKFVRVNGTFVKPSYKVKAGDIVEAELRVLKRDFDILPQSMPLDIVYEDEHIIVINKPANMVVHPAKGHVEGTLVNALMYHCGILPTENEKLRPGVVHRLDMDTTGLILFAKTYESISILGRAIYKKEMRKEYTAIVWGDIPQDRGYIDAPIGRDTIDRKKMAVTPLNSHNALTEYKIIKRYGIATILRVKLHTGRTHQIRVHLSHIGYPVIGDKQYGGRDIHVLNKKNYINSFNEILKLIDRQALHATILGFEHPIYKKYMLFRKSPPDDMIKIMKYLEVLYV